MNNSHSNISGILLFLERYHQNREAVLAATGMNGLTHSHSEFPRKVSSANFILLKIT